MIAVCKERREKKKRKGSGENEKKVEREGGLNVRRQRLASPTIICDDRRRCELLFFDGQRLFSHGRLLLTKRRAKRSLRD